MAKKSTTPLTIIKKVSCSRCKFMHPGDHPAIMWCGKIRMPMPSEKLNQCIYKIIK